MRNTGDAALRPSVSLLDHSHAEAGVMYFVRQLTLFVD
jgi:hypothetical protein